MAKKQTRRSVSISLAAYRTLMACAETNDLSGSALVEHAISALAEGNLAPPTAESEFLRHRATKRRNGTLCHEAPCESGCGYCGADDHTEPSCQRKWTDIRQAADSIARTKPHVVVVPNATPVPPRSVEPIRLPAQLTEPALVQKPHLRGARGKIKHADLVVPIQRIGLCAICAETASVQRTQLDVGGPLFDVCNRCNDEPVVERDHLFGSQPARDGARTGSYGIGDGNRRASAKGNRQ